MWQNYFNTALRSLFRHRLYSAINVVGLAGGLAACILILLFVQDEFSYDKHWKNSEHIYQLNTHYSVPGSAPSTSSRVSGRAKEALSIHFPQEIEAVTRINRMSTIVGFGGDLFSENIHWVDPEFLDVFDMDAVAGQMDLALKDNSSIAINESMAKKYFGDANPIGQILEIGVYKIKRDYRVAAVFKDLPGNTTLNFQALVMIDETDFAQFSWEFGDWYSANGWTFLKLRDGKTGEDLNSRLPDFVNANIPVPDYVSTSASAKASEYWNLVVQKLTDVQLHAIGAALMKPAGDIVKVMTFITIAGLIMLVGCFNFINLSTAKSTKRAREVSLRKVMGARRGQLVVQYLGESIALVIIALILSLAIVELTLPGFSSFLGKDLSIDYFDTNLLAGLTILVIFVGVLAGFYPALVVTRFKPAEVLKANKSAETAASSTLRQSLVVFQFSVSIGLMVAAGVIYGQMHYTTNMDIGFNKNNLLSIMNVGREGAAGARQTLRDEIARLPGVTAVSLSGFRPAGNFGVHRSVKVPGDNSDGISLGNQIVGHDFFDTYQISLLAGRTYDKNRATDGVPLLANATKGEVSKGTIVLNKAAVTKIGYGRPDQAIGRDVRISIGSIEKEAVFADLTIVGVVEDTLFHRMRDEKKPEAYYLMPNGYKGSLVARFEGDPEVLVANIRQLWKSLVPTLPFQYEYVDEVVEASFVRERHLATLMAVFALFAISIACLGLYGLASFTAERKTKEIGIRKVLGATVMDIVRLLVWQFSRPVLLANLLAWPVAVWSMMRWLETFPYRLDFWYLAPLCLAAGLITIAIAWVTIGSNAAKVARTNPIKALRYE